MNRVTTVFFWTILIGAIYHLLRDIMQVAGVRNSFTELGHWQHLWCTTYCDYVTLPLDIFFIVASAIILSRKQAGILSGGVAFALFISLLMWLTP